MHSFTTIIFRPKINKILNTLHALITNTLIKFLELSLSFSYIYIRSIFIYVIKLNYILIREQNKTIILLFLIRVLGKLA